MESNPFQILLKFDRWATDRVFNVCKLLSDQQMDTEFPIGLGSLRKTLAHLAAGMDWWLDHFHQRTLRPYNPNTGSLDEMHRRFVTAWDELAEIIDSSDEKELNEEIVDSFDNEEFGKGTLRFRRSAVLLHVFNHGTHHRVQCLNMFRHLGIDDIPDIDLIDSHQVLERGG